MIKHIILWKLKEGYEEEEKQRILLNIKIGLEALKNEIPGIVDIKVQIERLDTSNADLMLDSTFETTEYLAGYTVHPSHVRVAENLVKPFVDLRVCLDFET